MTVTLYGLASDVAFVKDGYDYKPSRFFPKTVERLWHRYAKERQKKQVSIRRYEIDTRNVIDAIMKSKYSVEEITGRRLTHVVCGPEIGLGIRYELAEMDAVSYGIRFQVSDGNSVRVLGMTVHVIPWFDGLVLLPELETKGWS